MASRSPRRFGALCWSASRPARPTLSSWRWSRPPSSAARPRWTCWPSRGTQHDVNMWYPQLEDLLVIGEQVLGASAKDLSKVIDIALADSAQIGRASCRERV